MTEVAFHFNVADKIDYACRLLRKASSTGASVAVVGEPPLLQTLDVSLWSFSALDFVPHCLADAPAHVLAASPIVLASDCRQHSHSQTLLHLGQAVPAGFERFERLIEVVTADAEDRAQARERWRHYADRGYTLKSHDTAARSSEP